MKPGLKQYTSIWFCFCSVVILEGCKKESALQNSNWGYANTHTAGTISDISFTSHDTGFILGYTDSFPFLSKTTDGGLNWSEVKSFDNAYPRFLSFYPVTSDYILAIRDTLYNSFDGGHSWNRVIGEEGAFNTSVFHFYFTSSTLGYAISSAGVYKTDDATHWILVHPLIAGYNFIQFTDSLHGFVGGGNSVEDNATLLVTSYGLLAVTSDGGLTWQDRDSGSWLDNTQNFRMITGMSFLDNQRGFIATEDKKLLYTADGGASFNLINSNVLSSGLYFESAMTGYYLASQKIYRTTDGGKSFSLDFTANADLLKIGKGKNGHICAVGFNGIVLLRN